MMLSKQKSLLSTKQWWSPLIATKKFLFSAQATRSVNVAATRGSGHNPLTDLECERSHGELIIPCFDRLTAKLRAIKNAGPEHLHLLTDYDQTLTKAMFHDGSACDSSFRTVIDYESTPEQVRKTTSQLYKKYMPIEKDASLTREEKVRHLESWWLQDMEAFSSHGYSREDFAKMTLYSKLLFRHGTQDLLRLCKTLDIKAVIVSGGIYELIEESLRLLAKQPSKGSSGGSSSISSTTLENNDFSWVNILSNQFEYEDQVVKGYKTPLIHSANKLEIIYDSVRREESSQDDSSRRLRKNVIVMGDIVEDGQMACEESHDIILRIGFLNTEEHYKRQIDLFRDTFDLIVYKDGSLCPIIYSLETLFLASNDRKATGVPKQLNGIDGHQALVDLLKKSLIADRLLSLLEWKEIGNKVRD